MTAALNLLIVEDSPSDARLLEACLEEGMLGVGSIEREATLEGALARISRGDVDAVLLDLGLPDSSGLDTIRQIVTSNPEVPVVIVSGLSDTSVAEEAVALGAQDYVLKDAVTPKDLARAVTYAIRRQEVIEETERAKRDQLEAKDRFLSHVSHELRTPLAAVHQFVSLVADETAGPLVDEQRECLRVAMRNIKQLALMIGDLLVMGRMSSGVVEIRPEHIDMFELIEDCVSNFRPLAADRGVDISIDVDGLDLPAAWCDPLRTVEVLSNLLDNAIKFTPTGGSIAVRESCDAAGIHIAVQDTGRGVQPENRERVFEQYFREAGDGDSGRGGLGVGLFVSRDLVERQGGRMWLETDASARGSCFEFTLPTKVSSHVGAAA
jgi:two-component system sensor histidine kinase/response regulator